MTREIPWLAVVSEDGRKLYFDYAREWNANLKTLAASAVAVTIGPVAKSVTQDQRGYLFGVIVPIFQRAIAEPSKARAYRILLDVLDWMPGDPDPSTADAACDREAMSDIILRATALLVTNGHLVPDPEPDPVRRLEKRLRGRAA